MSKILRYAIGFVAIFMGIVGIGFLLAPAQLGLAFFVEPIGSQGLASIRADFGGFFVGAAVFAGIGIWTRRAEALLVPLLLVAIALFGRILSLIFDGMGPAALPPMIAEAAMIALLYAGWRRFRTPQD